MYKTKNTSIVLGNCGVTAGPLLAAASSCVRPATLPDAISCGKGRTGNVGGIYNTSDDVKQIWKRKEGGKKTLLVL